MRYRNSGEFLESYTTALNKNTGFERDIKDYLA